jgi:hypothetical protein
MRRYERVRICLARSKSGRKSGTSIASIQCVWVRVAAGLYHPRLFERYIDINMLFSSVQTQVTWCQDGISCERFAGVSTLSVLTFVE